MPHGSKKNYCISHIAYCSHRNYFKANISPIIISSGSSSNNNTFQTHIRSFFPHEK